MFVHGVAQIEVITIILQVAVWDGCEGLQDLLGLKKGGANSKGDIHPVTHSTIMLSEFLTVSNKPVTVQVTCKVSACEHKVHEIYISHGPGV